MASTRQPYGWRGSRPIGSHSHSIASTAGGLCRRCAPTRACARQNFSGRVHPSLRLGVLLHRTGQPRLAAPRWDTTPRLVRSSRGNRAADSPIPREPAEVCGPNSAVGAIRQGLPRLPRNSHFRVRKPRKPLVPRAASLPAEEERDFEATFPPLSRPVPEPECTDPQLTPELRPRALRRPLRDVERPRPSALGGLGSPENSTWGRAAHTTRLASCYAFFCLAAWPQPSLQLRLGQPSNRIDRRAGTCRER
jgi:hypothetical protein